jgi:hypothetical protein
MIYQNEGSSPSNSSWSKDHQRSTVLLGEPEIPFYTISQVNVEQIPRKAILDLSCSIAMTIIFYHNTIKLQLTVIKA